MWHGRLRSGSPDRGSMGVPPIFARGPGAAARGSGDPGHARRRRGRPAPEAGFGYTAELLAAGDTRAR
ncbi:hypothetical protein CAC01_16930 [Streptomyces sp. CLI2509]|nr:hypothetical protein CAC01_16930 [Streptomyces sp. CLI2509]